jgi:acetyl esterase
MSSPFNGLGERLRRRTGTVVVDSFFYGIAAAGRLHPRARPERHNLEVLRDVPYLGTGLPEHRLDIYRPRDAKPGATLPVVLYVHGGGFRILSKDTHWLMAIAFARRGYVVFNIGYRLAPRHPFPAAIADVCAAYEWVARHAAEYGGDPDRIVLAGESAGANLVTSLALTASYRRPEPCARAVWETGARPRAVVAACGMLQVSDPQRIQRRWPHIKPWVNDRILEVTDTYLQGASLDAGALDLADPLVLLERGHAPERPLPPFFAPCGTKDPLLDDSRRLKAALERLGVACEAPVYEGEVHAFHALIWRPNARSCWEHTFRFLDRHVASGAPANENRSADRTSEGANDQP